MKQLCGDKRTCLLVLFMICALMKLICSFWTAYYARPSLIVTSCETDIEYVHSFVRWGLSDCRLYDGKTGHSITTITYRCGGAGAGGWPGPCPCCAALLRCSSRRRDCKISFAAGEAAAVLALARPATDCDAAVGRPGAALMLCLCI